MGRAVALRNVGVLVVRPFSGCPCLGSIEQWVPLSGWRAWNKGIEAIDRIPLCD